MKYHLNWLAEDVRGLYAAFGAKVPDYTFEAIPDTGHAVINAKTPEEAFRKFLKSHPNFRDSEGDQYVTISERVDNPDDPDYEAGLHPDTGKIYVDSLQ